MKIRTQFYVLIAGIVFVPSLVTAGLWAIQRRSVPELQTVPGYAEVVKETGVSGLDPEAWQRVSDFISHRPASMDFIVADPSGRILFSTIRDFPAGATMDGATLQNYIRATSDTHLYQIDSPVRVDQGGILVVTRITRVRRHPPDPIERWLPGLALFLTVLFVLSAVGSLLIARSITRSVTVLEEATRRIASGELDLAVAARGSNEITSLTASLNSMRLALKEEESRRARFIMGVTHDLKTPLALIKGYAEAIGDGLAEEPEERDRYVGIIASKVDQLDGMVDDLIDFVRVDTGEWRRNLERRPLAPFLRAFARRLEADALLLRRRSESSIDVGDDVFVSFDQRLLTRALENLANNALRYTEEGGVVRIGASRNGPTASIEISDDGPGMEAEELSRIFDPFYRGSSSRREQGMGLGLSVVKGIVDSHGWEIEVRSRPGTGSRFVVTIPLET